MRVSIVDLDWIHKKSFTPDVNCMKLSSYHKQCKDLINFPTNEFEIALEFDLMYIVRNNILTPIPKNISVLDPRVQLLGNNFKFYQNYVKELPDYVLACRPDYQLYPMRKENQSKDVSYWQFYANGSRLTVFQDAEKADTKLNMVVDEDFWRHSKDDIRACLQHLLKLKNIAFKFPIYLEPLFDKSIYSLFSQLRFAKKRALEFETEHEVALRQYIYIDLLLHFRASHPRIKLSPLKIPIVINHNVYQPPVYEDFAKYLQLACYCKERKFPIIYQSPARSFSTFWYYFEELESWTIYDFQLSFIERLLQHACVATTYTIYDVLNNSLARGKPAAQWLFDLAERHPIVLENYGYIEWGDKKFPHIDFYKLGVTQK